MLSHIPAMMEGAKDEGQLAAAALRWLVDAGCASLVSDSPASWLAQPPATETIETPRAAMQHPSPAGDRGSAGQHMPAGQPDLRQYDPHEPSAQRSPSRAPQRVEVRTSAAPASVSMSAAAEDAARLAASAKTLDELIAAIENFEGCPVKATANRTVVFDGNPDSRVMLIGEAPGAEEDRQGKPFVGETGHLLDRMLAAIGLDRESTYITNVFFWRPPGNRTPTPQEIALCQPFVRRQVELVRPKAILALGGISAKALFESEAGITRLRGQWKEIAFGEVTVPVLASFHPSYLLRQPTQKRLSWEDLLTFKDRIGTSL